MAAVSARDASVTEAHRRGLRRVTAHGEALHAYFRGVSVDQGTSVHATGNRGRAVGFEAIDERLLVRENAFERERQNKPRYKPR